MRHRRICCWLLALSGAFAERARAQPDPAAFELAWTAPPACPTGAAIRAEVLRLAGASQRPRELRASVEVAPSSDGSWTLTLRTLSDGVAGERVLRGQSCRAVADAATLTLALILNPEVEIPAEKPAPSAEAPSESAAPQRAVQPGASPVTARRRATSERVRWAAFSQLGANFGLMPSAGAELGLGLRATLRPLGAALALSFVPPEDAELGGRSGVGGRLWGLSALASGCWAVGTRVELGLCLAAALNRLEGRGVGVANHRVGVIFWWAPGAALRVEVPVVPRLALGLAGVGLVPLSRPRAVLEDLGTVHRPGPVEARIQAVAVLKLE